MALTHSTSLRNAMADVAVDRWNAGDIQLATDNTFTTILAVIPLANPAAASASAGVAAFLGLPVEDTAADASGTATDFRIRTSGGIEEVRGSVSLVGGGGDLQMINNVLTAGEPVRLTTAAYTAPQ